MLEHVVLAVGELTEDAIRTVVHVELSLVVWGITVSKIVVLDRVRVNGQAKLVHVGDEVGVGVGCSGLVPSHVSERVWVEDPLRVWTNSVGHLSDLIPVVFIGFVMSQLDEGEIRKRGILLKSIKLKRFHNDGKTGGSVSNCAHAILSKHLVQHFSHIVASLSKSSVVVLELDVETNLGFSVVHSRSFRVQGANVVDNFLQGDHFEFVVECR